ncbi:hypothetical protein QE152_g30092 [Popillia japonica]|uniref:SWIM-type domain-containing protein n=1 Tax=Popillia japonica TaxID=7064 RepID=A0AAW1JFW0_POPJA
MQTRYPEDPAPKIVHTVLAQKVKSAEVTYDEFMANYGQGRKIYCKNCFKMATKHVLKLSAINTFHENENKIISKNCFKMATKHVLKLSAINTFHENENKIIRKGENALESGHVKQMGFDAELLTIRGQVSASMKNKDYKVEICLNKDGDIILANWSCPRGIKCHHIAALALFAHYNIAATDVECVWNIPKGKPDEVQTSDVPCECTLRETILGQVT